MFGKLFGKKKRYEGKDLRRAVSNLHQLLNETHEDLNRRNALAEPEKLGKALDWTRQFKSRLESAAYRNMLLTNKALNIEMYELLTGLESIAEKIAATVDPDQADILMRDLDLKFARLKWKTNID